MSTLGLDSKSSLTLAVATTLGCAVEVEHPEPELGARTSDALDVAPVHIDLPPRPGPWVKPFVRTERKLEIFDTDIDYQDLPDQDVHTCWLSALDGNLYHPVSNLSGAQASTGHGNELIIFGVSDSVIKAKAVCINRVAGRLYHSWNFSSGGSVPTYLGPVTNRQCFLTEMRLESFSPPTPADGVRIYEEAGGRWLTGFGNATDATAVCLDIPSGMYSTSGVGGTTTLGFDEGDNACGLTGIYGPLTWGKYVDLISPDPPPGRWLLRVSSGNAGGWACMREKPLDVAPLPPWL